MEQVLLYVKKMFTAQRILYDHRCLRKKVYEKYIYQRKRSFLHLLLLLCGDVEKCPGPTESNNKICLTKRD